MKRPSQSRAKDLPSQLFASNPALLIGAAFEIGMLLGRRSGRTAMGRKLRENVSARRRSPSHKHGPSWRDAALACGAPYHEARV